MSGKVVILGVAGAGSVDRQDENFAADLADARIGPGQLGLTLVSVGRQNRLRAVIAQPRGPSVPSPSSSFEIILRPETRLHVVVPSATSATASPARTLNLRSSH
jgi:hypothetical protein